MSRVTAIVLPREHARSIPPSRTDSWASRSVLPRRREASYWKLAYLTTLMEGYCWTS